MGHHESRREVMEHGEPAEHSLGDNAERQQERQPGQIAPKRAPGEGKHGGDHRDDPDDRRDRPIPELDQSVHAERRQRSPAALRPVLTTEPGIGSLDRFLTPTGGPGEGRGDVLADIHGLDRREPDGGQPDALSPGLRAPNGLPDREGRQAARTRGTIRRAGRSLRTAYRRWATPWASAGSDGSASARAATCP